MSEIVKVIAGNSTAFAIILAAISLLVVTTVFIYVVAFFQGRSISFWPPTVGAKPQPPSDPRGTVPSPTSVSTPDSGIPGSEVAAKARARSVPEMTPIIQIGTEFVTSSRMSIRTESTSYTGVAATLMKAADSTGKRMMIKLFWRGLNPASDAWAEFSNEFRAAEILRHRNVVKTIDRGLWNGYPFIVFEFMAGGTLYDLIKSRDRIPGAEILSVAEQVAAGIDYAHTQGRVHRDISPSNILLETDVWGRVAISDFGIARILGAVEAHFTRDVPSSILEGTPAYVAPEAFTVGSLTPSADIYSFGVVLFEMIAGKSPFPPQSPSSNCLI